MIFSQLGIHKIIYHPVIEGLYKHAHSYFKRLFNKNKEKQESLESIDHFTFDKTILLKTLSLSESAYNEADNIVLNNIFTEDLVYKFPIFLENKSTDAQVYMWLFVDKKMYIAFRGSESVKDFMINLNVSTTNTQLNNYDQAIEVHNGFYHQYMSLQTDILKILYKHIDKINEIIFCGHSLGGSLAQIASIRCKEIFPSKIVSCITFGSPRTGNSSFCSYFESKIDNYIRVINKKDPITMIPFHTSFSHVDRALLLKPNGLFEKLNYDIICWSKRLINYILNIRIIHPLYEHSCKVYRKRIINLQK